jgi:hypothetical protein
MYTKSIIPRKNIKVKEMSLVDHLNLYINSDNGLAKDNLWYSTAAFKFWDATTGRNTALPVDVAKDMIFRAVDCTSDNSWRYALSM